MLLFDLREVAAQLVNHVAQVLVLGVVKQELALAFAASCLILHQVIDELGAARRECPRADQVLAGQSC